MTAPLMLAQLSVWAVVAAQSGHPVIGAWLAVAVAITPLRLWLVARRGR